MRSLILSKRFGRHRAPNAKGSVMAGPTPLPPEGGVPERDRNAAFRRQRPDPTHD